MRRVVLLLAAGMALVVTAVATSGPTAPVRNAPEATASPHRQSPGPQLRNIRACAYEAFSKRRGGCTRDQSGQAIYSSQVNCSATLANPNETVRVSMEWAYDGGSIWRQTLVGHGRSVWTTFSLGGPFPLPGGTYRCRLATSATSLTTKITSSGPTGDVLDTAICDRRRSHMHYGNRSCLVNADGQAVSAAAGGIVCNAAFVKVKGRKGAIRIVDAQGKRVQSPYSFVVGTALDWRSTWSRSLPSGGYRCQFLLDGVLRTEERLLVTR